jgi:amidophosphoribosyltransferase
VSRVSLPVLDPYVSRVSDGCRSDRFHDECGVVGVWGHPEAATLAYLGLHALQHRGQEAAGIVSSDGRKLFAHRGQGLVADVFGRAEKVQGLAGDRAIGHVRYSTAGGSEERNVQPLMVQFEGGLAVGHNGNWVDSPAIRKELEATGSLFQTTSDTEVLVHLIAMSPQKTLVNKLVEAFGRLQGAGSIVLMTPTTLIAAVDPMGFRPLVLGRHASGAWVVASETCALDLIEAQPVRDIEPGEVVVFDDGGIASFHPFPRKSVHRCVFEYLYFARPDSRLWGRDVHGVRVRLGETLAAEHPAEADVVVPVPDSGVAAALGYARASGIDFDLGLIRNHYVGRSFIEPSQRIRDFGVKLKLNPVADLLVDKRVVVVDDSLVRGTTCKKIVRMLRRAGAREVHLRIAAPPTTGPCHYGIDTPTREELIASKTEVSEIGRFVGADSIGYLSVEGMHAAVHGSAGGFCDACFTGRYPVVHEERGGRPQLPLFHTGPR